MAGKTAVLRVNILSDYDARGADKAAASFDKLQRAATVASTAIVAGVGAGMAKAVSDASALGESVNAVSTVFGSAAGKIDDFGKTAADSAGLSQRAFNDLATGTGALLQNMGYSADQAADSTINLAQRAADMASVFNTDVDSAMEAIQSGLRGQSEPLLRYGVSLDQAAVKAQAMAMGLYDGTGAISDQAQALATEALILEQTAGLAGDFANTSDSLANRQRTLTATMENTSAQLGEALLPAMESLVGLFQSAVEWIAQNQELFTALVATLAGLATAYLTAQAGIKAYNTAADIAKGVNKILQSDWVGHVAQLVLLEAKTIAYKAALIAYNGTQKAITAATKAWTAVQKLLNVALRSNPIGIVVTIVGALVAIVIKAYQESETFRNIVNKIGQIIKNLVIRQFERFVNIIKRVVEWVRKAWDWVQRLIDKLKQIKMPSIKFPSLPWNRSLGTMTMAVQASGRSAGARAQQPATINIYVSGAVDPVGTAEQIQSLLNRQRTRMGAPRLLWDATT